MPCTVEENNLYRFSIDGDLVFVNKVWKTEHGKCFEGVNAGGPYTDGLVDELEDVITLKYWEACWVLEEFGDLVRVFDVDEAMEFEPDMDVSLGVVYNTPLKGCPFCGSPAKVIKGAASNYFALCTNGNCSSDGPSADTRELATTRWNTRV